MLEQSLGRGQARWAPALPFARTHLSVAPRRLVSELGPSADPLFSCSSPASPPSLSNPQTLAPNLNAVSRLPSHVISGRREVTPDDLARTRRGCVLALLIVRTARYRIQYITTVSPTSEHYPLTPPFIKPRAGVALAGIVQSEQSRSRLLDACRCLCTKMPAPRAVRPGVQ